MTAARAPDGADATALGSNDPGAFLNLSAKNEGPVRTVVGGVDLLSIEPGEENQSQRVIDLRRSIREEVAYANGEPAFVQTGRVIQTCKWEKFDFDFGDWSPGTQFTVRRAEDGLETFQGYGFRFFSVFGTILIASLAPLFASLALSIASDSA